MNDYQKRKEKVKQTMDMAYGHVLPQAPEAEKAVLGALMINREAYVVEVVTGTDSVLISK